MAENDQNNEKLDRLVQITEFFKNQKLLNQVGLAYRTLVLRRTRQGKDIEGNTFQPYSAGHASLRQRLGEPTHVVNLQMDHIQGMLHQVGHSVTMGTDFASVEAWIQDPEKAKIGRYHHVQGAGKSKVIRKWWGLSNEQETKMEDTITSNLNEILQTEI